MKPRCFAHVATRTACISCCCGHRPRARYGREPADLQLQIYAASALSLKEHSVLAQRAANLTAVACSSRLLPLHRLMQSTGSRVTPVRHQLVHDTCAQPAAQSWADRAAAVPVQQLFPRFPSYLTGPYRPHTPAGRRQRSWPAPTGAMSCGTDCALQLARAAASLGACDRELRATCIFGRYFARQFAGGAPRRARAPWSRWRPATSRWCRAYDSGLRGRLSGSAELILMLQSHRMRGIVRLARARARLLYVCWTPELHIIRSPLSVRQHFVILVPLPR